MGKDTEGLQKMRDKFEAQTQGVTIPTQVRWLVNPRTIGERRQKGEIATSSVVFVVKGSKVGKDLVKMGNKAAGVWYHVKTYTNVGPHGRCELCCGRGHIENKCSTKPTCGYCSGHPWTSNHKCNVVGCTAKPGSLCGHTLEKYTNCKGNHIVFRIRCAKKTEDAMAARQSLAVELARRSSANANAASDVASGTNRVVLGHRPRGIVTYGGRSEAELELVDVEEEGTMAEIEDITMTDIATTAGTLTASETATGALATND